MSSPNRLAILGHRGWVASAIIENLSQNGASVKVLHRKGSDISKLPPGITTAQIDLDQEDSILQALTDIDIFLSLVGHEGIADQAKLIPAIRRSSVKLFVPSDLSHNYTSAEKQKVPLHGTKERILAELKEAGVPFATVLAGNFAEFALGTPLVGVNIKGNQVYLPEGGLEHRQSLCTSAYVAAAYVSLFADSPCKQLAGRKIGLVELQPSGQDIIDVLTKKHHKTPEVQPVPISKLDALLKNPPMPAEVPWLCMKKWGEGTSSVGDDVWDVEGYQKATLEELVVGGKLRPYRAIPITADQFFGIFA